MSKSVRRGATTPVFVIEMTEFKKRLKKLISIHQNDNRVTQQFMLSVQFTGEQCTFMAQEKFSERKSPSTRTVLSNFAQYSAHMN